MTRSVAEIIGFKRVNLSTLFGSAECWARTAPAEASAPYTTDDLLAWLREQDINWYCRRSLDGDHVVVNIEPAGYYDDAIGAPYEAPTLLAALERAVLAVAGES